MILKSGDDFASRLIEEWSGKEVTVSKTTPMPPITIKIESARVAGWDEVDKRIQKKHDRDTKFLTVNGRIGGENCQDRANVIQFLVIPVDHSTVYEAREDRLVVLTEREVVQFSPAEH